MLDLTRWTTFTVVKVELPQETSQLTLPSGVLFRVVLVPRDEQEPPVSLDCQARRPEGAILQTQDVVEVKGKPTLTSVLVERVGPDVDGSQYLLVLPSQ